MSTLGLGGLLAGRLRLERPATLAAVSALVTLASVALTMTTSVIVVTIAQATLALLIVVASIHVTRLLHDAVPSAIRTGVASGASAISWMVFLPIALAFGMVSTQQGVHAAGWILTAPPLLPRHCSSSCRSPTGSNDRLRKRTPVRGEPAPGLTRESARSRFSLREAASTTLTLGFVGPRCATGRPSADLPERSHERSSRPNAHLRSLKENHVHIDLAPTLVAHPTTGPGDSERIPADRSPAPKHSEHGSRAPVPAALRSLLPLARRHLTSSG